MTIQEFFDKYIKDNKDLPIYQDFIDLCENNVVIQCGPCYKCSNFKDESSEVCEFNLTNDETNSVRYFDPKLDLKE